MKKFDVNVHDHIQQGISLPLNCIKQLNRFISTICERNITTKDSPGKLYNIAAYNLVMVPLSGFVVLDDIISMTK